MTELETKEGVVQATKHDQGKRQTLAPIRARVEIEKVSTYGATKYKVGNWHEGDSFNYGRLIDAYHRHTDAWELGEDLDPETGLSHLAHASWCLMALMELQLTGHGSDDRRIRQYFPEEQS